MSVQLYLFWGSLIQDGLPAELPWPWPGHELTMVAGVEAADDRWVDLWRTSDGYAIGSRQVCARPDGDGQVRPSDVQGCKVQPWRNLKNSTLGAILTFSATLGKFGQHLVARNFFYCLNNLTLPNQCNPFGGMFSKPIKGVMPTSTFPSRRGLNVARH